MIPFNHWEFCLQISEILWYDTTPFTYESIAIFPPVGDDHLGAMADWDPFSDPADGPVEEVVWGG